MSTATFERTDAANQRPERGRRAADTTSVPADLDPRLYAGVLDRLAVLAPAIAVTCAVDLLSGQGHTTAAVLAGLGVAFLGWLALVVLVGLTGWTPGRRVTRTRLVDAVSAQPLGVPRAALRALIVTLLSWPTLGVGVACLAWTVVADRQRTHRGWHDHLVGSMVVGLASPLVESGPAPEFGVDVVNLTAMRLAPDVPAPTPAPMPMPAAAPAPAPAAMPAGDPRPLAPTGSSSLESGPIESGPADSGPAARGTWRVSFDTGEQFVVDGLTLVGRAPEPRPGEPVRRAVSLPSTDMSLSKTHAQFLVTPYGDLVVLDRGSTNGSLLHRGSASRVLRADAPVTLLPGDRVHFGDRIMTVEYSTA